MHAPVLEAIHLTKHFPPIEEGIGGLRTLVARLRGTSQGVVALQDLCFTVEEGEIFGLLGPNGAGKTTFCKILNALVIPTSGTIQVRGLDSIADHRRISRDMITVFGGESDLFGLFEARLSCELNLQFVGDLWGLPRAVTRERMEEAIELLDLGPHRTEWYQKLSGGTKQKLFLAMPLILRRRFVILDEPTIRLDVPTRRSVQDVLRRVLNREMGTTVLLTTHDLQEAERLCDRVGILSRGKLICVDTPQRLRQLARSGPIVRVRLKASEADLLRAMERALAGLDPAAEVTSDPDWDESLKDGRIGFVIHVPTSAVADGNHVRLLLERLAAADLAPERLEVEEPSLEDAFVELLGRDQIGQEPASGTTEEAP